MGKRRAALAVLVGLCVFFATNPASAKVVEDESGMYVGLAFKGTSFLLDWNSPSLQVKEDGGAIQLCVGYRFNPVFMLELTAGGSNHGTSDPNIDAGIVSVQLFGYYRFLPERPIRPYIKGGLAGYSLILESGSVSTRMDGGGIAFGAGVRCFLNPHVSLGIDFTHNIIRYNNARLSLGQFSYESGIDEHGRLTTLGFTIGYSF